MRLSDGTLVQVGKSTEARDDLLARFRAVLGLVTLSIVVIALGGGLLATQSAIAPIRALIDAVKRIIETGRTDARVPQAGTGRDEQSPSMRIIRVLQVGVSRHDLTGNVEDAQSGGELGPQVGS